MSLTLDIVNLGRNVKCLQIIVWQTSY